MNVVYTSLFVNLFTCLCLNNRLSEGDSTGGKKRKLSSGNTSQLKRSKRRN